MRVKKAQEKDESFLEQFSEIVNLQLHCNCMHFPLVTLSLRNSNKVHPR